MLPGFKKFMKYNGIDDDAIRIAANLLQFRRVEKGQLVFKQDDRSEHFFGIIKGRISIRERVKIPKEVKPPEPYQTSKKLLLKIEESGRSMNLFRTYLSLGSSKVIDRLSIVKLPEFQEEEKFILLEGQCFGEWGLIYKKDRGATAFALETTDLFTLDALSFDTSFNVFYFKYLNCRNVCSKPK